MWKENPNGIIWVEAAGFAFVIAICWLAELLRVPHHFFGESPARMWNRALLRTVVLLVIWAWVHFLTRRLLKRLHYLEEFLRVCGWCRKVCHDGEWMDMERYFKSKFSTKTSHGMCPECLEKKKRELSPEKFADKI